MAKSIRSKSGKKTRAIKHATVFKAVEDARTHRLSAKLQAIPVCSKHVGKLSGGDIPMDLAHQVPLVKTGRWKKTFGFNPYGTSKKDSRF